MPAARVSQPSRYDLYRWCVQDAPRSVRFLAALHGWSPKVLREDFAGPAGIAAEWASSDPGRSAIAIDADPEPLRHAPSVPRLTTKVQDVRRATAKADVIALFNFAICELHRRADVLAYFKRCRAALRPGGIIAMDLYGGTHAHAAGQVETFARSPDGRIVQYTWQQVDADPATAMVTNAIHFRIGRVRLRNAFTYRWRLWTLPEMRDLLGEAGFRRVEVHNRMGGALDADGRLYPQPMTPDDRLEDDWVAYVVARK